MTAAVTDVVGLQGSCKIEMAACHVDAARMRQRFSAEWDQLDDTELAKGGYQPWERLSVLLHDAFAEATSVVAGPEDGIVYDVDDVDVTFPWRQQDAEAVEGGSTALVNVQVSATVRFTIEDAAALVQQFLREWAAVDEARLAQGGYQPWERFKVFLSDLLDACVHVDVNVPDVQVDEGLIDHQWDWDERRAWVLEQQLAPPATPDLNQPQPMDGDQPLPFPA